MASYRKELIHNNRNENAVRNGFCLYRQAGVAPHFEKASHARAPPRISVGLFCATKDCPLLYRYTAINEVETNSCRIILSDTCAYQKLFWMLNELLGTDDGAFVI